jgi:hypothetical protein
MRSQRRARFHSARLRPSPIMSSPNLVGAQERGGEMVRVVSVCVEIDALVRVRFVLCVLRGLQDAYQMSRRLELSSKYPLTCTGRPLGTGRGRKQ